MGAWKRLGFDGKVLGDGSRTMLGQIEKMSKLVWKSSQSHPTIERCAATFHAEPICQKSDISVLGLFRDKTVLLLEQQDVLLVEQQDVLLLEQEDILLLEQQDILFLEQQDILLLEQPDILLLEQHDILLLRYP